MKPITRLQEELLMECHERQLLKQEPLSTYHSRFAKGLVERGLIATERMVKNEKPIEVFCITQKGIEFLDGVKYR